MGRRINCFNLIFHLCNFRFSYLVVDFFTLFAVEQLNRKIATNKRKTSEILKLITHHRVTIIFDLTNKVLSQHNLKYNLWVLYLSIWPSKVFWNKKKLVITKTMFSEFNKFCTIQTCFHSTNLFCARRGATPYTKTRFKFNNISSG